MGATLDAEPVFEKINLLSNNNKICFVIKGAFTPENCRALLDKALAIGFSQAHLKYPKTYRNNERIQLDEPELAEQFFAQCRGDIPQNIVHDGIEMSLTELNTRLRFCKYSGGQAFSIHQDGSYHKNETQRSALTFLLYLNDSSEYVGGTTSFFADQQGETLLAKYQPSIGDVLVFEHDIWHSGDAVFANNKYILRSDFIYKQPVNLANVERHHKGYIWKIKALPDGTIVTSSRDKTIKIWDEELTLKQSLSTHQNSVLDMQVNKQGDLYAVSRDGFMSIWLHDKEHYYLHHKVATGHPCALSITATGEGHFITTGSDNKLRLWDEQGVQIGCSNGVGDWQWGCLMLNSEQAVTCSGDGKLNVWRITDLVLVESLNLNKGAIRCMQIHDQYLLLGFENGCIGKLDLLTLTLLDCWQVHRGSVTELLIVDSKIVSCSEDNLIKVTSFDGDVLDCFDHHQGFVTSIVKLNHKLYSVSYDGYVGVTDITGSHVVDG